MKLGIVLVASGLLAWQPQDALEAVKSEGNLEKRSEKSLEVAEQQIDQAAKSYQSGELEAVRESFGVAREAVVLSWESLMATGKNPRKSPKYFKRAEITLRKMLRRLNEFRNVMSVDDRPMLQDLIADAQKTHDKLLAAVMSRK
jgi:hypothetical protein